MTLHTLHSDDQHQQVSMLLPWYLNQSLDSTERRMVENHIRSCMLCRRELTHLEKLAVAVKHVSDLDVAAEVSFDKLRDKLNASRPNPQSPALSVASTAIKQDKCVDLVPKQKNFWTLSANHWIGLAIAASLLVAIVPFTLHTERSSGTDYHTLSDARPEPGKSPTLRVVFKKLLPATEIDALLAKVRCRRTEGPNSVGAYTAQLDEDEAAPSLTSAIEFLRSQQNVMLAEPVLN